MKTSLIIDNTDQPASGGATFVRSDPNTGQAVTEAAAAGVEDVRHAIESSAAALRNWSMGVPPHGAISCSKQQNSFTSGMTNLAT